MGQKLLYPVIDGEKQCGECKKTLSVGMFYKTPKGYYSSKCKDCAKEYASEYRSLERNKEKISEYHKTRMKNIETRTAKNKYTNEYRKRDYVKAKNVEKNREWKMQEKQKAVDYLGGKCSSCGYSKCLTALEFHHVNPSEKELYNSHWTFERNKNELDKCVLLCANCHREEHAKEIWKNE